MTQIINDWVRFFELSWKNHWLALFTIIRGYHDHPRHLRSIAFDG